MSDPLIIQIRNTTYAFKWFKVREDGALFGSFQGGFRYKKDRWQEEVPVPAECERGYHVLHAARPLTNQSDELWLVAVRGTSVQGDNKSVYANVRPIVKIGTSDEVIELHGVLQDVAWELQNEGRAALRGLADGGPEALMRRMGQQAGLERMQEAPGILLVKALIERNLPDYGPGSYYQLRDALRLCR